MALIIVAPVFAQQDIPDSSHSRDVRALVIVYDISYPKKKPFTKKINCYKEITIIHGAKVLTTYYSNYGRNVINLSHDGKETLYDVYPNQKVMVRSLSYRKDKESSKIGSVQLETERTTSATDNIKQIMNINCNEIKVGIKILQAGFKPYVTDMYFYTYNKVKGYEQKYSAYNVEGLVLGSDCSMGFGCIQQERAVLITEQVVDSSIFDFPKDYTILSYEELHSGKKYKAIRKAINKEIGFGAGLVFSAVFNPYIDLLSKKEKTQGGLGYVVSMNSEFNGTDSLKYVLKDTIADSYYYQELYMKLQEKAVKSIKKVGKTVLAEVSIDQLIENGASSDAESLKYVQYLQYLMQGIRMQAESKGFLIPISVEETWGN